MGARVASTKALSLQQEADTAFGRVSVAALWRPFIRWSRPRLFISWSRRAANGFKGRHAGIQGEPDPT
jgi:hypothetical protein